MPDEIDRPDVPDGPHGPHSPDRPDRPDLRHHGDAEVRDDGRELTDLAVNVRTGTPPPWLKARIAASLDLLAAYPDQRAARRAVASRHSVAEEQVLLTAGAAEAFVLLARALRIRQPVVVHPQFTEPEAALTDAGHRVERVMLRADDGFRMDADAVPESADLVVVGNPTNPTSVLHPATALAALARPGRTLVVDEAFIDAVPDERESLAPYLAHTNTGLRTGTDTGTGTGTGTRASTAKTPLPGSLVVLRSLTKTWGLAGLRIGYVLSDPATVAALSRAQPLWPVSAPALAAAEACCGPYALAEAGRAALRISEDRAHLLARMGEFTSAGLSVHGSPQAPFVLVRHPEAASLRDELRTLGFAVRRGDTFPGLGRQWLRIAVREKECTDRLATALAKVLDGH
jgi:histidinol-phosphate aminotransferase